MSEISHKEKVKHELQVARARSSLYSFLALIYGKEPNLTLLHRIKKSDFIQVFSELGIKLEKDIFEQSEQELLNKLVEEYTRLFIGPGRHISPHESVHRKREGVLWGDSTPKVKAFIERSGLKYRSDFKGIPDHISVELEFMHRLVEAELEAREKNNLARLEKILRLERRFFDEHILKWIPRFTDKIAGESRLDFYRKMAQFTKEFILFEEKELGHGEE